MLVAMAGLPGTGKSTVAMALARELDGAVLSKDVIRAALFPDGLVEYSLEQDDFVFGVMLETAEYLFRKRWNRVVILDGRTFARECQRREMIRFAEQRGLPWRIVECVCAEATAVARIACDAASGIHPAKNRTPALYFRVRGEFESIREPKIVVDTDAPLPASLYSNFRVSYSGEANSGGVPSPPT